MILYYPQGLSLGEIAQRLACPLETIESRAILNEALQAYDPTASYGLS